MIVLRLLAQTVLLALGEIWANKVRAFLAILLIAVGAGALVLVTGGFEGFKRNILKEFSSVGANKVWVFPRRPPEARDRFSWRKIRMNVAEADGMLANCPSLERLTPILEFTADVQFGDRRKPFVKVQGIRPIWHEIEQRFVTAGRPFSEIDLQAVRNVCLVNDKAIEELGLPGGGPGNYILVGGRRFLIVGIVETKMVSMMFGQNDAQSEVYIPFNTALAMKPDWGVYVVSQTKRPELFEDAKAELTFYMRKVRGLKSGDPNTFGVEAIEQYIAQVGRITTLIQVFAGGLTMVALVVGGIAIMVIMLVSVTERTREIGVRLAIGALEHEVLLQFLIEAVVLSSFGGLVGIALAAAASIGLSALMAVPYAFQPGINGLAFLFSAAIGVVFGYVPARRAARLDPIEALRHE